MLIKVKKVSESVVVIENENQLFVLEELQGNEREAFVCHEHIDTAEGAFQPCQFAEGLFQIGSEGEGVLITEKENPAVLRRMVIVYCSDLLKSVVSIIRLSG